MFYLEAFYSSSNSYLNIPLKDTVKKLFSIPSNHFKIKMSYYYCLLSITIFSYYTYIVKIDVKNKIKKNNFFLILLHAFLPFDSPK